MSRIAVVGRLLLALIVLAALAPATAMAEETAAPASTVDFTLTGRDHVAIVDPHAEPLLQLLATDPLELVLGYDRNRAYTLSTDLFDLWVCGTGQSASSYLPQLEDEVADYFTAHSGGAYRPVFNVRGDAGGDSQTCGDHAVANPSAGAEGAIVIGPWSGGVAYNQYCGPDPTALCAGWESFPSNLRIAFVGETFLTTTAAHEIGHLVQWPHSYTGNSNNGFAEYDNASDLMSGNLTTGGFTNDLAYETAAINRYAAGWIDPGDVWVVDAGGDTVTLSPTLGGGTQMAVIWEGSAYYTLAARAPEPFDPIPSAWSGVEVYRVEPCADDLGNCSPGYRRVIPEPATPFAGGNPPHVIGAGGSRTVGGVQVQVSRSGSDYVVRFGPGADPGPVGSGPGGGVASSGTFTDDNGSVFESDIEWLADAGITAGCNPPQNDRFCPNDPVTRGAMAAFLHRALPDLDDSGAVPVFTDIGGSVFLGDIQWLAATGVTKGCNPPQNSRFCPGDPVTRGAMAAFLVRALGLTASSSVEFTDDDNSVFETDIEKLATARITLGCNPPQNTRFCPNDPVTRGAMAAFLRRALE